ncbi:hypothetical protein BVRB_025200 [Beta vulgaris subsp. vulgaris]|uniref:Uncharacterized protein n=1 Tax=Beta vulgaris subsp. vulgaris TaxID=3555 RepID=A0A0J8DTG1_BETVV|nr:hypothetical protein BVRB_025200 [Beta vulgaris subsp. vulgaris]
MCIWPCEDAVRMEAFGQPDDDLELTWRHLDKHRLFVWQFIVFMAIRLGLYPSTLIKTHMQARPSSSSSISLAFSSIYKTRGIAGFWSGFPSLGENAFSLFFELTAV